MSAAAGAAQAPAGPVDEPGLDRRALHTAFAVVVFSADGRVQSANHRFLRLFGCGLTEVVGSDLSGFFSSSVRRQKHAELWQQLAAGQRITETGLWVTRRGDEVWLESRYLPMTREDGEVEAIVLIAEDVTQRKSVEADEHGQVLAIERSHAVAHCNVEGAVTWANETFLRMLGYTLDEIAGQPHEMLVDIAERGSAHREFWSGLVAGHDRWGEFCRLAKDGSVRWVQAQYSPVLDPAGRPHKVVVYASDVTERRSRLADYEWQVQAIHKSNCVVTLDLHGSIQDANDRFLAATGYSLDEIRGRHHRMFVDGAHAHSSEYATFWSDLRAGRHCSGQYKRLGKGGREIWLQATYNPIFDAGGRPVKVIKYASVVTNERLLQAEHQSQIAAIDQFQCVVSFETDGTVVDANDNFLRLMGYRYCDVRGKHHRLFVDSTMGQSEEYAAFWSDLAAGHHRTGEYKRLTSEGREVWLRATYSPIRDMNGRVFKVVKYATDITHDKLSQAEYQAQIEAIRRSQDVAVFALDGTILEVNDRFVATMGYDRDELVGQHHSLLVGREHAASPDYETFWTTLRSGQYHSGLYKRIDKGGKEVWIQASYNPIMDLNGRPTRVIKFATDVSGDIALAEANAEVKRQAQVDATTALPNRAKLAAFMQSHIAGASASMAVFYIDLDHFGRINDTWGRRIGDRLLGEVADRLRRLVREDQMVARVGGDEFVVAAPGMSAEAMERFCRRLFEKLGVPVSIDETQSVTVGLSVGIAMSPADATTTDDLLRAADAALGRAKQNGRGIQSYFSEHLNEQLHGQRALIEDMRDSFAAGHFFLEFQPRFDALTQRMRGVEALARWAHPERGRVSPAAFIPLAEQSGLIVPLGDWILHEACRIAARWTGVSVSVNVSPVQLQSDDLVAKVRATLAASGLPASRLELEITEGVLVQEPQRILVTLLALKELGIRLAIDDFGTGYSSMSTLRKFPFDVIKIDRSFVQELEQPNGSRPIVQAILALAKALSLTVVAEGVETEAQSKMLREDQCDEIQGFLLGRPTSAETIEELVDNGSP